MARHDAFAVAVIVGTSGFQILANGKVLYPKGGPDNNPIGPRGVEDIVHCAVALDAVSEIRDERSRKSVEDAILRVLDGHAHAMKG